MEELINLAPIKIEQNNNEYFLNISINENIMTFSINCFPYFYFRAMSFKEIKNLSKAFYILTSINDFYIYLSSLSVKKKIKIKKNEESISVFLFIEVLFKKEVVEIILFPRKRDLDLNFQNI